MTRTARPRRPRRRPPPPRPWPRPWWAGAGSRPVGVWGSSPRRDSTRRSAWRTSPGTGFCPGCHPQTRSPIPTTLAKAPYHKRIRTFSPPMASSGSKDHQGDQVDDGTYKVVDDRTFVVSKEFPEVTFHYRVTGDDHGFDPVKHVCAPGCLQAVWIGLVGCSSRQDLGARQLSLGKAWTRFVLPWCCAGPASDRNPRSPRAWEASSGRPPRAADAARRA